MYNDRFGDKWFKVGLHTHTTLSDGQATPERMADIYKNAGFDAVAITDHWVYHAEDEINGLKIISGCEYNLGGKDTIGGVMHIVGIGMKEKPELNRETASRQQTIDEINRCGGMAVLAHPAWSLNTKEDVKSLHGFSMFEIYNTVSDVHQSFRPYSGYLADVLANDGITFPLTATDDVHYYDGTDEAKSFICVKAKSGSVRDILDSIKRGEFYASQGPELYVRAENGTVSADCRECSFISFVTNSAFEGDRVFRGEDLVHAEYKCREYEKFVRVEIRDKDGKYAWSNFIKL